MISLPLVSYVLLAALRDRLIPALLSMLIVAASLSFIIGSAAVVESGQFALVYASGTLRFVGVFGLVLFVVFHMRRSFENRDVDYLLSRPIGRTSFVVSHAAAFSVLAIAMGIAVTLAVMGATPHSRYPALMLWGTSVVAEYLIMVNVALFFSMVLTTATTGVLATLALYGLARIMGELLGILAKDISSHWMYELGRSVKVIGLIVPRLDLMGQTSWLIYGDQTIGYGFIAVQVVVYIGLVLSATVVDLKRRQF